MLRALRMTGKIGQRPLHMVYRSLSSSSGGKGKDYIDVEIIDNTKKKKTETSEKITRRETAQESVDSSSGLFGIAKRTAQSAVQGLSKLFGRDEESMKRKQRTAAFNAEIDRAMQHTGLLGGLMGRLVKSVGGVVINSIAEGAKDMENIRAQVEALVESDKECVSALGGPIQLYPPMSTSASSMSVNGKMQKSVVMLLPVQGSRGSGQVQVMASADSSTGSKEMVVNEVIVQLSTGRVIEVPTTGRRHGKGRIIDV